MINYSLKPLSPHLTIYNVQNSSFSSILHRITGIIFLLLFFYISIFYLNNFNLYSLEYTLLNKFNFWVLIILKNFFKIFITFHVINGLKFILWNFNYLIKFRILTKINQILFIISILTIIFI